MPKRGKRWILVKYFDGFPKKTDVKLEEFDIPTIKDGEVLMEAEFLSVDPYMRPYTRRYPLGSVLPGQQVAKVIESRNTNYPVGTWVIPFSGWTTHSVSNGEKLMKMPPLPEGVPRSYTIGTIGMPGLTAYFGLLDICEPKKGETVMVSGAAGAVGSVVGQIAKIKGCRVIGSAGSDEKLEYLKEIGFDAVFNYKTVGANVSDSNKGVVGSATSDGKGDALFSHETAGDLDAKLKELAPEGIDVYFDNVGGDFASTVILNMNRHGRIANCGAISSYNDKTAQKVLPIYSKVVGSELKMQGFIVSSNLPRYPEGLTALAKWVAEGKIKVREHVTEGFENMFTAFTELFTGANLGKAIIKV